MKRTSTLLLLAMLLIIGSFFATTVFAETASAPSTTAKTILYKPGTDHSESAKHLSTYSFSTGTQAGIYLYYGTVNGEQIPLESNSLTSSDPDILTVMAFNENRYALLAKKIGTATLTYTVGGSVICSIEVTVDLPNGYYITQERTEKNYLSSNISWYDLNDGVIWFLTKDGFTEGLDTVTVMDGGVELSGENYTFVSRYGNNTAPYDLKITLPEPVPGTSSAYTLQVLQNEKKLAEIRIGALVLPKNEALSIGDYVIGFSYKDYSGITRIIDGLSNQCLGGTTAYLQNKYMPCPGCDELGVSVGIICTDVLGGKYYEIVENNNVKVTISRVWIEHVWGEKDSFSLSAKEHKTEIDPRVPGNDWQLYWKQGHNSYARLCATVSVTLNGQTVTGDISTLCRTILDYIEEYNCAKAEIVTVEDYYDKDGILQWGLNTYLNELAVLFEKGEFDQYTILLADVDYKGTVHLPAAFAEAKYKVVLQGGENTRLIGGMDLNAASVHCKETIQEIAGGNWYVR